MSRREWEAMTTVGVRLERAARRLASRRAPSLPWLRALAPVIDRVSSLPSETRFERHERPGVSEIAVAPQEHGDAREPWSAWTPLQPHVQARLHDVMGAGSNVVRVHDDPAADAIARHHHAEAVTVGQDVFFRRGRFQPQQDDGFALLAHETAHVLQATRPGAAWRRATDAGARQEEREAGRDEQRVRAGRAAPSAAITAPARLTAGLPSRQPSSDGVGSPVLRPMAADLDRQVDAAPAAAPMMPDLERLRRDLHRDLMSQIRADFERGA